MVDRPWRLDPEDPRAPSEAEWAQMTDAEKGGVRAGLPSEVPRSSPPEGDRHRLPKTRALEALGEYFRRIGRKIYLSSELPVYYPAERLFAPDLIAVLDVEPHEREHWIVSHEGKGLDLVLEVTLAGDAKKDLTDNVVRYARLGIPEYFVFDARTSRLVGYELDGAAYRAIAPRHGRWPSAIFGLDLSVEQGRVRFYSGSAPLLEAAELIARLESMTGDLLARKASAEDRAATAEDRAERLAQRLRELGVNPDE